MYHVPFAKRHLLELRFCVATSSTKAREAPMALEVERAVRKYTPVKAARGLELSCKGWAQEAALRMLMNNLDPEVAERPRDLVVYGGTGGAARDWECFDAIVRSLRSLEDDETL